ncbi:hypothetical protein DL768_001955 [Monosporascus sp. mg162]|nr:hypothetical protein DL768_001955 [Monosporascus sp. mg162]
MVVEINVSDVKLMTRSLRERTIVIIATCYPLAVLAVAMRFVSRRIARNYFWWDDWLSVVGLTSDEILTVPGLPSDDVLDGKQPIETALMIYGTKGAYVAEIFYYINQCTLKFSILCFYWRVFSASNVMKFIVAILQCVPVQAIWDPAAQAQPGVKCIDLNGFFFGTSIPNILADFVLVLLPIRQVLHLNITVTQKALVIYIFLLGGFWPMDDSVVWTVVENCCGVISICLPSLRPILKLLPWETIQQAFVRSYGTNKESGIGTRMGNGVSNRSLHQAYWSEIESTNCVVASHPSGIRKETRVDVDSIEMQPTGNSSSEQLAGQSSAQW